MRQRQRWAAQILGGTALLALVSLSSCWTPGVTTVYAQTLPITKTVMWDPNPPEDAVINYVVRLDGVVIGSPTGVEQVFTVSTAGTHTLTVVAVNAWGESSPGTLVINVVLPTAVKNVRIKSGNS